MLIVRALQLRFGRSQGVTVCLEVIVRTGTDGILIPIPQYPLYSATIDLLGGRYVGYYLNEAKGWEMDIGELRRALKEAREQGTTVRALAVINPGNPTGQTLSLENMKDVVKFCEEEALVLMADEVYQANVYGSKQTFTSFRKVVTEMNSKVEVRMPILLFARRNVRDCCNSRRKSPSHLDAPFRREPNISGSPRFVYIPQFLPFLCLRVTVQNQHSAPPLKILLH